MKGIFRWSWVFGGVVLATASWAVSAAILPGNVPTSETHGGASVVELADLNLQDAIRLAKGKAGGKVLSATAVQTGDTTLYRIKLIQGNGRIVTVVVDGANGRITEG